MKGTVFDFLRLASEKPELAKELVELAVRHNFEFNDEVSDEELDSVAGGVGGWDLTELGDIYGAMFKMRPQNSSLQDSGEGTWGRVEPDDKEILPR